MVHEKVVESKVLSVFLVVLLSVVMALIPSGIVKADYRFFSGTLRFGSSTPVFNLEFVGDDAVDSTQGKLMNYKAEFTENLIFTMHAGMVYDGYAQQQVTYELSNPGQMSAAVSPVMSISIVSPTYVDGITVSAVVASQTKTSITVLYRAQFNGFLASYGTNADTEFILPTTMKLTYSCYQTGVGSAYSYLPVARTAATDWTGYLYLYDDATEIPGYDNSQVLNQEKTVTAVEEGNALQEQANQLQEESNQLQEESNEIQKGIFDKISDFFNNFFENLGNTIKSWFIPTSEELSAFLDEVNTWFGDRLGFIWYPFDLAIDLVAALGQGEASSIITVPGYKLNIQGVEYVIWNEIQINLDEVGIFQYVRYFTSAMLCCAVGRMAIKKWDSWIGGRH